MSEITPTVCAAVLVPDHRHLDHAFEQEASYLLHAKDQPGFDFISRTVECTKAGLGLRLFMTVAAMGEAGLARHLEGLVQRAREAADLIRERVGFELAIQPETNILCFRIGGVTTPNWRFASNCWSGAISISRPPCTVDNTGWWPGS